MSDEAFAGTTPGRDRVVFVQVGGHQFGYRKPTRADVAEAHRKLTAKLTATAVLPGAPEADILNNMNGKSFQWEARLEIGLLPRRRGNEVINLGESAPEHWLWIERDADGKELRRQVSFDEVDPAEFDAVVAALEQALAGNASSPLAPSTPGANGGNSV